MANIKVAVRVRPISEREIHFTGSEIVVRTEEKAISLTNLKVSSSKAGDSRERTRRYGFDYCFDSSDPHDEKYAGQSMIYKTLGESILDVLFRGYNSCLVAYGQSASGKTYTMMGSKEDPGLTPRICQGLFLRLANEENNNTSFEVFVSYLEVYNERVRDLLKPSPSSIGLRVREHPRLGPYVQGLTHHAVSTLESLISQVEEGTRARKTASTLQNPTSSRSHALLTLSLVPSKSNIGKSVKNTPGKSKNIYRGNEHSLGGSKLHLVDLAGSESATACGGINRLKEGANINKSLVALGNVISALAERASSGRGPGRRFIPYRDSALTWLLKDALGGNATTIMLATISPATGSYNETSHTLRFAQRAQSVVNRPVINEDPVSRIIKELRAEVARLKSLLLEKNIDPDCKSICVCQRDEEREPEAQDNDSVELVTGKVEENKSEGTEKCELSIKTRYPRISERRHSTSEDLLTRRNIDSPVKRFASFEIVRESENSHPKSIETDNYNRAKVSELIINDEINEPVFVDIPTLVAVLIKPDDHIEADSHQIEAISSDDVPEDDADFSENIDNQISSVNSESQGLESNETSVENISCSQLSEDVRFLKKNPESHSELSSSQRERGKLRKHDSIDSDFPAKSSNNLQISKKYGSTENLSKKRETACSFQRSQTNLDKRNGSLDKIKKLNNIREVDDHKSNRSISSWRNFSSWTSRDFQRKGSNDSDKSLKESPTFGKFKNQLRKQSIDGLKRKSSKDSSSSSSKDELTTSGGSQNRGILSRKGSLEHEQVPTKTHTPIQRARRAEIVAAVTERLYSSKKPPEDSIALTGTTASTPASEICSPESADVKLANATRMRLQEISRKMLAKRRKICVDTQTDNNQTVRVRDASCLTEEPKTSSKDASVSTDHREYSEIIRSTDCPVRRVKEIATSTDPDLGQLVVRCKDAANVTEDYYEDYRTVNSPRIDSGIMSDDTQNYAESNLSSAEASDLSPIGGGRNVELVENSTNTRLPQGLPNSGSQTRREDFERTRRLNCSGRCCNGPGHCQEGIGLSSDCSQTCHHAEKNVISISLPEMLNITIETTVGMESKIKVFDGNESIDDRTVVSLKDNMAQTDKADSLEIGTSTRDISDQVYFRDFSTEMKPLIGQADGRIFRIENIFHEPRDELKTTRRIDTIGDSLDDLANTNSFVVTNSIGTSHIPEPRGNATGKVRGTSYSCEMIPSVAPSVSLTIDEVTKNKRSLATNCTSNHQSESTREDYCTLRENQRSFAKIATNGSGGNHDRNTDNIVREKKGQCAIKSDDRVLDEDSGLPEDSMAQTTYEPSNGSNDDTLILGLKSPAIIAMLDRKVNAEQDANFSDDSLDLRKDEIIDDNCNNNLSLECKRKNGAKMGEISTNEKICPPDLVVHTKKDMNDSSGGSNSFDDFDEDGQHVELPKMTVGSSAATNFSTPLNNLKTLILGDVDHPLNYRIDSNSTGFGNQSSSKTFIDEDYLDSTIDVIEDTTQDLMNCGRSVASKSIIKKPSSFRSGLPLTKACQSKSEAKNLGKESCCTKKVRFTVPEVNSMTSSDSEAYENLTSDDEFYESKPRTILERYLNEAVIFMRNMNSMNEYMSASNPSSKRRINDRKRQYRKGKCKNYIEYEGRRISLNEDADERVLSDEDGNLDFNAESYEECLRSMDKLEKCLARVKQHDDVLRDKYGIGTEESTVAKLDLARFSIDSSSSSRAFDDVHATKRSNGNNDEGGNNAQHPKKQNDGYSSESISDNSENQKNRRVRKFSRFSDLRKRHPTTYSQLKMIYGCQASDTPEKQGFPCSAANVESFQTDGFGDTIVPDSLQTPDCYLILPKTTRNVEHSPDKVKGYTPRKRFSLSKYDSSNDSSSSNEALASFMESIDDVARSRTKIKYPGSPRAKFLQLLRERRRIVETTRKTGPS